MIEYKGFEIHILKTKKNYYRIFRYGVFKGTLTSERDAKARIDFCVDHKVWT
jgi:hypothetical protein